MKRRTNTKTEKQTHKETDKQKVDERTQIQINKQMYLHPVERISPFSSARGKCTFILE